MTNKTLDRLLEREVREGSKTWSEALRLHKENQSKFHQVLPLQFEVDGEWVINEIEQIEEALKGEHSESFRASLEATLAALWVELEKVA